MFYWITGNQFPFYSLVKGITKNSVNFFHCAWSNKLRSCFYILRGYRFNLEQVSVILIHNSWRNILQLHITDDWANVIGQNALSAFIGGKRPGIHSIDRNILIQKVIDGFSSWNNESSIFLLKLNLSLTLLRLSIGFECFPTLTLISILVDVCINY